MLLMVLAIFPSFSSRALDKRALDSSTSPTTPESQEGKKSRFILQAQAYFINPNDVLLIQVFDVSEISRDYRVSATGTIILPLLPNQIKAAGLTPDQLAHVIAEKYRAAGVLNNPQVMVTVKESRVYSVAITGAVKKPQVYPVFGPTTLLDVLSHAEGLADDAGNSAVITRGDFAAQALEQKGKCLDSGRQATCSPTFTVDIKRLLDTGDPDLNADVYPGDRVTVRRAGIIYVVGAVNRPGGFPLKDDREDMTVLKAVALAEDLKPTAIRRKAIIIRRNSEQPGQREEIAVDLARLLAGKAPDPPMSANDILFVPDSTSKKAVMRGVEAAIQITTGLIIWRR
jgi:polysaccharide export outer membrane protein